MELVRKIAGKIRRKKDDHRAEAEQAKRKEVIRITPDFLEALQKGLPVRLEAAADDQQTQEEEEELDKEKYKYRLVGEFCHPHPNIIVLNAKARWLWGVPKRAEPLVVPIGQGTGYYLINTETKKEMKRALKRKPRFFYFQMMRVFRPRNFGPSFDPELDEGGMHFCWIKVPDIPNDYTKEEVILAVWTQIGRPLKIELLDESNARLYVAIKVRSQPKMQKEMVLQKIGDNLAMPIWQSIIYEEDTFPPYCSSCRTMGHAGNDDCPFKTEWTDSDTSIEEEMKDDAFILYGMHYAGNTMNEALIVEAADTILTLVAGTQAMGDSSYAGYAYKDGKQVGYVRREEPSEADDFGETTLVFAPASPKRYTLENFPALQ